MHELDTLTAVSPVDGRYGNRTARLRAIASEYGLIRYRVVVEARWLAFLADRQVIDLRADLRGRLHEALNELLNTFGIDEAREVKRLEATTNHDVKACEYFVGSWLASRYDLGVVRPFIHFACTSEDINNLAYGMMLKDLSGEVLIPELTAVRERLAGYAERYAAVPMLSRTHGQSASPTTVGKEFAVFAFRLSRQIAQLESLEFLGKFAGAVGNYNAHTVSFPELEWPELAREFVESLGLSFNPLTTQIESHDYVAEFAAAVARANTILIDFARDVWGYISLGYFGQRRVEGEIGSSTMPHKINPIDFENAEGNLGVANALMGHFAEKLPISRWQRDLTDSTVLRNLGSAVGYASVAYQSLGKGLDKLEVDELAIARDLDGAWEVLAEAVQTVMRRYGVPDSYERLKALTRGEAIDAEKLAAFIDTLELPPEARLALKDLTPAAYSGLAATLAREAGAATGRSGPGD